MKLFSPAKINLFLRVIRKRNDGYHELASLFQAVSLGDTIHFSLDQEDHLTSDDPSLPLDNTNLILKAAHLFRQKTNLSFGLKAHIEKKIPMEAGLGGGSSNAATTLYALNQLLGTKIPMEDLKFWASFIGSDISFFFSSGTAYCTGRGEEVQSLPPMTLPKAMWVIKPKESLSTPRVFGRFKLETCSSNEPLSLLSKFQNNKPIFINDLEPAAFELLPVLRQLKEDLLHQGFEEVSLTGSGTALICMGNLTPKVPPGVLCHPVSFCYRKDNAWY